MKFYSEVLDEFFDSEKECIEAEFDRKKKQEEAEEKRRKELQERMEKHKFHAEKALAKQNLEKKIEALNKEILEYVKTYEKETPWLADLVEAIFEQPSEKKTKEEKRPAATPVTRNEFEKILEGFLN
ncbi:MAG: hypothetical protein LIR50_10490 [Bacillota bacterium]|nr:hypothetical protein [Bacillota bacterium]